MRTMRQITPLTLEQRAELILNARRRQRLFSATTLVEFEELVRVPVGAQGLTRCRPTCKRTAQQHQLIQCEFGTRILR